MSVFSTRDVTPDMARKIITSHLMDVMREVVFASDDRLRQILNTYVSGNGLYEFDNFCVYEGAKDE